MRGTSTPSCSCADVRGRGWGAESGDSRLMDLLGPGAGRCRMGWGVGVGLVVVACPATAELVLYHHGTVTMGAVLSRYCSTVAVLSWYHIAGAVLPWYHIAGCGLFATCDDVGAVSVLRCSCCVSAAGQPGWLAGWLCCLLPPLLGWAGPPARPRPHAVQFSRMPSPPVQ